MVAAARRPAEGVAEDEARSLLGVLAVVERPLLGVWRFPLLLALVFLGGFFAMMTAERTGGGTKNFQARRTGGNERGPETKKWDRRSNGVLG